MASDLRSPGAVLLVACYELGHPPLGLAWPAAFFERAGYAPAVLDLSVAPLDEDAVRTARLVAVAVPMHTALRVGVAAARRVREINPRAHVALFGLYATLNAAALLDAGVADSATGGECEEALVGLARWLEVGAPARAAPEGITLPGRPSEPPRRRLDYPVPSRRALPPLEAYARLVRDGGERLAGYVEATRGCKHRCRHCPIPPVYAGRFVAVPPEVVLADIDAQVAAGAEHVTFGDPDFLNGPTHALRDLRAAHAAHPALTFDVTAKVEHLVREAGRLAELASSGVVFVVSAVESLSDTVLARLDKGHTRADVRRAVAACRAAGLALRPTFVPFTPWSTLHDYLDILAFVESEGLVDCVDPVQYAIRLLVPPGSLLLETAALEPHVGPLAPGGFSYAWTHPDPRMDALHAAVARLVEDAAHAGDDPALTFAQVRELAWSVHENRAARPAAAALSPERTRPPHLTEPWFC